MLINNHDPQHNKLLQGLPQVEFERIHSHLKLTFLHTGQVLHEQGARLFSIYFPIDCIISLLYILENGSSMAIAVIGNEGAIGVSLLMGDKTMSNRAIVQNPGYAYRIRESLITEEFDRHGVLFHKLLEYTQSLINQATQTAVSNRFHTIDQNLCRWLLLSFDRQASNDLKITQELIANMLGVRRESVTEGMVKLHRAGIIQQSRGHIKILDRERLEGRVCEIPCTYEKI